MIEALPKFHRARYSIMYRFSKDPHAYDTPWECLPPLEAPNLEEAQAWVRQLQNDFPNAQWALIKVQPSALTCDASDY